MVFRMRRLLIFSLVGPLFGVTLISAAMALGSNLSWWLYFAIMLGIDTKTKTYIVIMSLLAWVSDVVLVYWEVQRRMRMIVLGGVVTILTVGLERYSTMMLVAGLICGAVTAFCVWLSDERSTTRA